MRKRLGDYLVEGGVIDSTTLAKALDIQKVRKKRLGRILMDMGVADDEMIASALARQLNIPLLHLSELQIPAEIIALVPHGLAQKHTLIPVRKTQRELLVAMSNPVDMHASDDLNFVTRLTITIGVASERDIRRAIVKYYERSNQDGSLSSLALENLETEMTSTPTKYGPACGLGSLGVSGEGVQVISQAEAEPDPEVKDIGALLNLAENPPIVRFSNAILTDAIKMRASDVHIELQDTGVLIRYRVDGIMREMVRIDRSFHAPLVSRIKVLANLDISERRKPQDGRYHIRYKDREYDLRVSTIPTLYGEKVVLRILDQGGATQDFKDLGLSEEDLAHFEYAVSLPQGIILLTGPTGSGKSSTIYAMLGRLNSPAVNIVTVEDPVEYKMRGLSQMQINPKAGITFATGLRAILRQDPDIVMLGEIRDSETAGIALQAAQTGHLVLSSLHTNDAPSAVIRLMDLGVPAFLISSSLIMVVSQRLLRRICRECKAPDPLSSEILKKLPAYSVESRQRVLYKGTGCNACQHTGYSGRLGIFEVLIANSSLRDIIVEGVSASTLKIAAEAEGFRPMALDGIEKAFQGLTTIEEVLRVAPPEPDIVRHLSTVGLATEKIGLEEPPLDIPILPRKSAGRKRILVVEDNEVTLRVLRSILEAEDYLVVTAGDGVEAMKLVLEERQDLIITDFLMPNMDGYTLIKKLQSQSATRDIPIMMLTQKDEIDSEVEVLASGASDYLVKPVNPKRLVARVRRLLVRHSAVG
jgi:type IV pilus assembly protein PilB